MFWIVTWVVAIHVVSFRIWFDWETVRFFVQPRPGRFGFWRPLVGNWIDLSDYGIVVASQTWRPLMSWLFQLEAVVFGPWAPGYHLINLAVHLACILLLYRLALRMGLSRAGAATGSLLFGVHPLVTQPLWILGDRAEQFVLLGGLAALTALFRNRPAAMPGGLLLALASKETAVTIPLWLIAADVLFREPAGGGIRDLFSRDRIRRHLPAFLLLIVYLLYRASIFGGMGGYRSVNHFHLNHLPEVILQNAAWLLTLPHGAAWMWIPVLLFVVPLFLPGTPRVVRWSVLWMVLFLMPVHNLCNKWYLYTPVAAVALWIGGWVERLERRGFTKPVWCIVLSVAVVLSLESRAELLHQARNAALAPELAARVKAAVPEVPPGCRFVFRLPPGVRPERFRGHWFNPATFRVKARKTPVEAVVWDLNGVRYTPDGYPVWSRSVEAALRLTYDDISLTARLESAEGRTPAASEPSCIRTFSYQPPPVFRVVPE